jgi:hypothetical protein
MTSDEKGRPPRRGPADNTITAAGAYPDHQTYMRGLGRRIRWLERHRHWWLRTEDGRPQREFLDRRDAA